MTEVRRQKIEDRDLKSEARKRGSEEARKLGSEEARKRGSWETRRLGSYNPRAPSFKQVID